MRWSFRVCCVKVVIGISAIVGVSAIDASSAWALTEADKEAIRSLSDDAATDFDAQRYEAARSKFAQAFEVAKIPSLALWTGRANEKLGHWVVAHELYLQATTLERNELWRGDAQQKSQQEAERELQKLSPRIPRLTIRVEGANAKDVVVAVDGVTIPSGLVGVERLIDPGEHQITGQLANDLQRKSVVLNEKGRSVVVLQFGPVATLPAPPTQTGEKPPSATPDAAKSGTQGQQTQSASAPRHTDTEQSSMRTWGWIGVGVGAAGIVTGSIAGILTLSKYGTLKDKCGTDRRCQPTSDSEFSSLRNEVDGYRTLRTVSTVGLIVGGVAAAAGVTLLTMSPSNAETVNNPSNAQSRTSSSATPALRLLVGPGAAHLVGAF